MIDGLLESWGWHNRDEVERARRLGQIADRAHSEKPAQLVLTEIRMLHASALERIHDGELTEKAMMQAVIEARCANHLLMQIEKYRVERDQVVERAKDVQEEREETYGEPIVGSGMEVL